MCEMERFEKDGAVCVDIGPVDPYIRELTKIINPFDYKEAHFVDADGNPAGGFVSAVGLHVNYQNGPLGRGRDRKEPNGTFVEILIYAAIRRLEFYQKASDGRFACKENEETLKFLYAALESQRARTKDREKRGVEGLNEK